MKYFIVFTLCLSLIGAKSTSKKDHNLKALNFHIDDHTPDQVLNEGQTLTLECRVKTDLIDGNDDWKTCRWTRASDGATCLYEYKKVQDSIINSHWEIEEFCEPGLSDAIYFGSDPNVENHICGIEFLSADEMDNSDWKCTMEECKTVAFGGCSANNGNGNYVEATMNVKVESINPTSPFSTSMEPNICDQLGTCTLVPDNGPYYPEGPCEPCYCVCSESGNYKENCCPDGLVFNPIINHCDWPFNNENCTTNSYIN